MRPETDNPYLVTLGFDASTFERLDGLRARYFPASLNQVPAHLSLFHHLPGEEGDSIDRTLGIASRASGPITLAFPGVRRIGWGMMLPVEAPCLAAIRSGLARAFDQWLTPQDRQPFHPHVTIMNKADRAEVEAGFAELQPGWMKWTGVGDRLILWRYLGGPWDEVESYALTRNATSDLTTPPSSRSES